MIQSRLNDSLNEQWFYKNILDFVKNRTIELSGLLLISIAILLFIHSCPIPLPIRPMCLEQKNKDKQLTRCLWRVDCRLLTTKFWFILFFSAYNAFNMGGNLNSKKQIPKILLKFFFLVIYLITSCVFIYITFNNSFWLIDNGNSGLWVKWHLIGCKINCQS